MIVLIPKRFAVQALLVFLMSGACFGTVITFEGFAPPGVVVNVNPLSPYTEAGFTFTPSNGNSAVFDSAATDKLLGGSTSWFGFAGDNVITLTGPVPFDLDSALIGPISFGSGNVNLTITGNLFGGGTVSVTFSNLTTATSEVIGFHGLQSATFSSSVNAGLDNITVTPEPTTCFLLVTGLVGVLGVRRWRRHASVE
jgi:hypothetical protein